MQTLDSYAKNHFSYEETLQQYNNYPGLTVQQEQHKLFLKDPAEVKITMEKDGPTRELVIAIKGKLIRWWIQHVRHLDRKFVDYLKTRQS